MCKRLYERNKQNVFTNCHRGGGAEDIFCANKQGDYGQEEEEDFLSLVRWSGIYLVVNTELLCNFILLQVLRGRDGNRCWYNLDK